MEGVEDEPPSKCLKVDEVMDSCAPLKVDEIIDSCAINKVELVRIIADTLYNLGYSKSASCLENESEIPLHSDLVSSFLQQILEGKWDESVLALRKIELEDESVDESVIKSASFVIMEQKFFDLLDRENLMDALETLRTEISPLGVNGDRVKNLSDYVVCPSESVPRSKSRIDLLEDLQLLLPPTLLFAKNRLLNLLQQVLELQKNSCRFHSLVERISLLSDHNCGRNKFPCQTLQILRSQSLSILQFSHEGKLLASSSLDCLLTIWEVKDDNTVFSKLRINGDQRKPVSDIAWSPDDSRLLTCREHETVCLWDVASGECLHMYKKDGESVITCVWAADGKTFFTGSLQDAISQWSLEGDELKIWRSQSPCFLSNLEIYGNEIVFEGANKIVFLDWETNSERFVEEKRQIMSFTLSGNFLLLSLQNEKLHLWKIDGSSARMVGKYKGHRHLKFFAQPCFGGLEQAFIAIGSEDSQVCIWHRVSGELITTLVGHSGPVNCVTWNPVNTQMLASSSADQTVRIWGV